MSSPGIVHQWNLDGTEKLSLNAGKHHLYDNSSASLEAR
jgi:hypothetical protein